MTSEELLAGSLIKGWKTVIQRLNDWVEAADDEKLQRKIVPSGNRVIYLVGHLAAVHDRMFPLLGLGDRSYAQLDAPYLENPDGTSPDPLSGPELKKALLDVNTRLTTAIEALSPQELLQKHTAVSDEDFAKDPTRNRFTVLLSRTNHIWSHVGQLILVK